MAARTPLAAERASSQDSTRVSDRIALGSAFVGGLIAALVFASRMATFTPLSSGTYEGIGGAAPARAQVGYQAPATSAPAQAAPTVVPPTPPPSVVPTPPTQSGDRVTVANTDGVGVVLRASPRDNDWTPRGFMDGAQLTVLERQGSDWARVRDDNGQEGWVPARYLTR
jgi:hypothetical protein